MDCSLPGSSVRGISQQEYWSGCHLLLQGIWRSNSLALAGRFFAAEPVTKTLSPSLPLRYPVPAPICPVLSQSSAGTVSLLWQNGPPFAPIWSASLAVPSLQEESRVKEQCWPPGPPTAPPNFQRLVVVVSKWEEWLLCKCLLLVVNQEVLK